MLGRLFWRVFGKSIGDLALLQAHRWKRRFLAATEKPREVQKQLLERILTTHRPTQFGRDHHFDQVHSLADFRRHVPILRYEDHEPYIERMRRGQLDALVSAKKVYMFALTSGTTANRKYIPVTPQYLADYRRGMTIWGVGIYDEHPKARFSTILQLASDHEEFTTEAGIPCGSVSGLTAAMQKRVVRRLYAMPPSACKMKDAVAKLYLALRTSLPKTNLGLVVTANPSTLVKLAQLLNECKEDLIRDLHDGTLSRRFPIEPSLYQALAARVRRPNRERARQLEAIQHRTGALYPKDCWPSLAVLGNWTGGSVGLYLRFFPKYYGTEPAIRDLGLIASEGRMSIPLIDGTPSGVLDITSHFFEFVPVDEIDSTHPTVLQAHEVEEGRHYYILPTTAFGLYRYNIFDVVRVTGFYNRTPLIEFLNKGSLFSNLTGEKLSEYQVAAAVRQAVHDLDLLPRAYALAPCFEEHAPFYGLFVERADVPDADQAESLAVHVDRYLRAANIEYDAKRASQRLGQVRPVLLPSGSWARWDAARLATCGGTAEQYKRPCLIADPAFREQMPAEPEPLPEPNAVA